MINNLTIKIIGSLLVILLTNSCSAQLPQNDMQEAAKKLLASLSGQQLKKAHSDFSNHKRTNFAFLPDVLLKGPKKRFGLTLKRMSEEQQGLALNLLNSALSVKGKMTVQNVIILEEVLYQLTKKKIRDKELYYVSIFGEPSPNKTWAWSFEGHHLSINVTLVDGQHISLTPSFFGSNPDVVLEGPHKGIKALAGEEDVARKLAQSLTSDQMKMANVFEKPPFEIFSEDFSKIFRDKDYDLKKGLTYKELSEDQKSIVKELILVYIGKYKPELLVQLDNSPLSEIESLVFVWVGSTNPQEPHYYRLVTNNHLIEYANTRNGGKHPHTVWREFDGDFGEDLLLKHFKEHH